MDFNTANEWAEVLKALSHPTRLQIVAELLNGTKCVTDIQDILPASQANISQHLRVLRHARVVDFAQDGSQRCYYVSRPKLTSAVIALLAEGESVIRKSKGDIDQEKQSSGGSCCVR
jgi:DNA-binding transcriptional ArsR family regulator